MGDLKIKKNSKIKLALDSEKPSFTIITTFHKQVDEVSILISEPLKSGKTLYIEDNQKLLLVVNDLFLTGYRDDIICEGIRRYWLIRLVQDQRQYFERRDERYTVMLPIYYRSLLWHGDNFVKMEGRTQDMSAGGVAMLSNCNFEINETVEIDLSDIGNYEAPKGLVAHVCWVRDAKKSSGYRNVVGFQFKFKNEKEEKIIVKDYIEEIKKRFNL